MLIKTSVYTYTHHLWFKCVQFICIYCKYICAYTDITFHIQSINCYQSVFIHFSEWVGLWTAFFIFFFLFSDPSVINSLYYVSPNCYHFNIYVESKDKAELRNQGKSISRPQL